MCPVRGGMGHVLEGLSVLVLSMTNAERTGGRIRRLTETRLELLDCMYWPQEATEMVQRDFPEVVTDIRACRQSLSGFSVLFILKGSGRLEVVWYIAIAVGLTSCAYALFASPWWGAYRWIQSI